MKQKLTSAGVLCAGTLIPVYAALLTLRNLGPILSRFLDTSGEELDLVAIFAQTADASIWPHWLIPLLLFTAFSCLLLRFPPKGRLMALWIALYVASGLALLAVCYAVSLMLTEVNGVRFFDLLRSLLPVIGSL